MFELWSRALIDAWLKALCLYVPAHHYSGVHSSPFLSLCFFNYVGPRCRSRQLFSPSANLLVIAPPLLPPNSLVSINSTFTPHCFTVFINNFFFLWLAPAVFKQSDQCLWPMILSGLDSLLSPWWRMDEALLCFAFNNSRRRALTPGMHRLIVSHLHVAASCCFTSFTSVFDL